MDAPGASQSMKELLESMRKGRGRPGQPKPPESEEPPKPRGRAARLNLIAKGFEHSVGSRVSSNTVVTSIPSTSAVESKVETLATSLGETTLSGPCYYEGTSGGKVQVTANYIRLKYLDPDKGVYEYDVRFNPPVDSKNHKIRILNSNITKLGGVKNFDGGSRLYLPILLPDTVTIFESTHPQDNSLVQMSVTFKKKKRMGECVHLFAVMFKRIMHALLYTPIGRNYYDPHHTYMVPQRKLEVLPGYAVAVEEYESGVMVCLDTSHRVLRQQNVLELLVELRLASGTRYRDMFKSQMLGTSVLTRYNNKNYIIDDIMWDTNPKSTFKTHNGDDISYIEYYKKQYNITLKDHMQPLLVNKKSVKTSISAEKQDLYICLVPELCYATGLTNAMRADFRTMKDIATFTRVTPAQRMKALRVYMENIRKTPAAEKILSDWGLELEKATIDLHARALNSETIIFGQGVTGYPNKGDWTKLATNSVVIGPIDIEAWILFYTKRDENVARDFASLMSRLGGPMGIQIQPPDMRMLSDDRTETYTIALKEISAKDHQIVVLICPTSRDDRYSAIKRMCCVHNPIPSQVINSVTLSKQQKIRAVTQKIALQINCKLGGALWTLNFPCKNWMICGIDVYHARKGSTKPSVCAFVANINETFSRWYSTAQFQQKELGDYLKVAFLKCLNMYFQVLGVYPSNIVIFRDGVGDGQLSHCRDYEVRQFEECLQQFNLETKLTFIVVQKRINTRIFLKGHTDWENPPCGTVLDHSITRRDWPDFFLVSQHVTQGTVTPTHYVVVYDAAKRKPDVLQKLAYKLCHLYYNWCGTIRVPAPCQYAHKLAYLVGEHVHGLPADDLSERLYYL